MRGHERRPSTTISARYHSPAFSPTPSASTREPLPVIVVSDALRLHTQLQLTGFHSHAHDGRGSGPGEQDLHAHAIYSRRPRLERPAGLDEPTPKNHQLRTPVHGGGECDDRDGIRVAWGLAPVFTDAGAHPHIVEVDAEVGLIWRLHRGRLIARSRGRSRRIDRARGRVATPPPTSALIPPRFPSPPAERRGCR